MLVKWVPGHEPVSLTRLCLHCYQFKQNMELICRENLYNNISQYVARRIANLHIKIILRFHQWPVSITEEYITHNRRIYNTTAIDIPGHIIIPQTPYDNYITTSMWEYQGKPWSCSLDHDTRHPTFWHSNFNHAWISNHMPIKEWDEIMFPFTNFNACKVEVWVWICNLITNLITGIVTYPY